MPNEIEMIKCPSCEKEWIRSEDELVCPNCTPQTITDMAIHDLEKAIAALEAAPAKTFKHRLNTVNMLAHKIYSKVLQVAETLKDE